ncbi:MAG: hypothetical protein JNL80_17470 [Phycisphaerae bacterium]|jgi:hypothetical protein|nr:hypothetical protein [Phycisphaerae bacterium]
MRISPLSSVLTVLAVTAASSADLPTYKVEVLGSDLQGFGMNERGDVVGRKVLSGNQGVAFLAKAGGEVEVLPFPAEWTGSDAYAINDNGVIVGAVSQIGIATIGSRAAAWYPTRSGYKFALLGALPTHTYSTALGVNNLGDIVGGSGGIGLGMYSASALFTGSSVVELPNISLAADINNGRVVLAGNTLLDLDTMQSTTIPLPPGNWQGMVAGDINNVGGFCGYVSGFSGCSTFPLIYMPDTGWDFVGGCATTTAATSINDQGDTLTYVYNGGTNAVFFDAGVVNIPSMISPDQGPWLITSLSIINNNRQILASGKLPPQNISQLIRLTPIVTGDLNGDLAVNASDLAIFLGKWGSFGGDADFNGNGIVDAADLSILLGAWNS